MILSAMAPAAPEIFLAVAGMAMMMVGVFSREGRALQLVNGLALASLTIALVVVVLTNDQREVAFNGRSEEHTSELQSLMRISYAVFCLKKKKHYTSNHVSI